MLYFVKNIVNIMACLVKRKIITQPYLPIFLVLLTYPRFVVGSSAVPDLEAL